MEEVFSGEIMPHDATSYYILFKLAMYRALSAINVMGVARVATTPNQDELRQAADMLSLTPSEAGVNEAQLQNDFRQALEVPDFETAENVRLLVSRAAITLTGLANDVKVNPSDLDFTSTVVKSLGDYYVDQHPFFTN
jgi:hypothetical protein